PYRTWGYPFTPILYVGVCVIVLINTLIRQPVESGWGLAILACGLPAYAYWKGKKARRAARAIAGLGVLCAALLIGAAPAWAAEPGIHGFHRGSLEAQRRLESLLLQHPDAVRVQAHARRRTEAAHVAGTPENEAVARYIEDRFQEAGLETEMKT